MNFQGKAKVNFGIYNAVSESFRNYRNYPNPLLISQLSPYTFAFKIGGYVQSGFNKE